MPAAQVTTSFLTLRGTLVSGEIVWRSTPGEPDDIELMDAGMRQGRLSPIDVKPGSAGPFDKGEQKAPAGIKKQGFATKCQRALQKTQHGGVQLRFVQHFATEHHIEGLRGGVREPVDDGSLGTTQAVLPGVPQCRLHGFQSLV